MLYDVLQKLEQTNGPIALDQLSQELGVEPGVLEDMIAFWVRKGRLRDSQQGGGHACPSTGCGGCSPRAGGCVFSKSGPRTITLISKTPI